MNIFMCFQWVINSCITELFGSGNKNEQSQISVLRVKLRVTKLINKVPCSRQTVIIRNGYLVGLGWT